MSFTNYTHNEIFFTLYNYYSKKQLIIKNYSYLGLVRNLVVHNIYMTVRKTFFKRVLFLRQVFFRWGLDCIQLNRSCLYISHWVTCGKSQHTTIPVLVKKLRYKDCLIDRYSWRHRHVGEYFPPRGPPARGLESYKYEFI